MALSISVLALIWLGPLLSGGLFLSRPTGRPSTPHDLPASYELRHKGYIDHSTGLYIREDEDLVLRRTPPFLFSRTYLSGDHVSRQFGIGTTNNAEWYLIGDPARFSWAELILANSGRIHFDRMSRGASYQNALFIHRSTPTGFYASRLGWAGFDWVLRFQDGGIARFQGCSTSSPRLCSMTQRRDLDGHSLEFRRDPAGRLLAIEAPTERIVFEYDQHSRIVRAQDDAGHRLEYSYDLEGRLVRMTGGDGMVRSYTYGPHDEMLTINDPGKLIENTFDENGRVTRQVTRVSKSSDDARPGEYVVEFEYELQQGAVKETNVKQYDGTHTVYRFDAQRYVEEEIHDAEGKTPVFISFDRDPVGYFSTAVKVWCTENGRRASGAAPITGDEEETKQELIHRICPSAR